MTSTVDTMYKTKWASLRDQEKSHFGNLSHRKTIFINHRPIVSWLCKKVGLFEDPAKDVTSKNR